MAVDASRRHIHAANLFQTRSRMAMKSALLSRDTGLSAASNNQTSNSEVPPRCKSRVLTIEYHSIGSESCIVPLSNVQQFALLIFLGGRLTQGLGLAAAALDNVLVQQRIVGHGVIAIVAGHAEIRLGLAGGSDHAFL
jgi:hypothetical protein